MFVKLKSWDWNICSSVAHPRPLCISSRVPVNPTCVSSQTLCFILYILFKPLPVNSYFSCISPQTPTWLFLLDTCLPPVYILFLKEKKEYIHFSLLKSAHLYILPNTNLIIFALYFISAPNFCQYILIFISKRKHLYILLNKLLFTLYFISFPKPYILIYIHLKRKHVHIHIPYPNPTRPPSHG